MNSAPDTPATAHQPAPPSRLRSRTAAECADDSFPAPLMLRTAPAKTQQPLSALPLLHLLDRLDSRSPPNPPTVLAVFRLYCLQQLTVAEVARRCRCSVGTVSNRLKLLRAVTGLAPEKLTSPNATPRPRRGRPKRSHTPI